eukprot:SAG31_NODE_10023_length_1194_cov_1.254795_2_plen_73_part_00
MLEYRLPRGRKQVPLTDAQLALTTVRARAAEWGIDKAKVGTVGFSAGGEGCYFSRFCATIREMRDFNRLMRH